MTERVEFERQILPLLKSKCFDCHGSETQESQLRLDRKAGLIRGGDSGEPAIVVGKSADSHLIKLVAGLDGELVMPPDEDERLTPAQIGLLRGWIDQGANWPGPDGIVTAEKPTSDHWSFQPVQVVAVPEIDDPWIAGGIDAFVLRKLREKQIPHNPPADRRTLIRRLSLGVRGLPPTPQEVREFVVDRRPDAVEKLVDRMLASPHYGEHWARHWLDLVRFAETHGFETNRERPHAWPFRDYVIESLNDDKPYDQFVREQIAGDVLGNPIGTGFLVAGPYDLVKSPDINLTLMQRQNELDDMIGTTGTAFLGLTIACARCHNHKFDPLLQSDYYSLQAIFAGVQHAERELPIPEETQAEIQVLARQVDSFQRQLAPFRRTAHRGQFLLIDDDPRHEPERVERLQPIAGHGTNPDGTARGQKSDPGDARRAPNVSRGEYSWWNQPKPGEPVMAWRPQAEGRFRVWLSWGCGFETHTADARYILDRDGDPATRDDWIEIARVDQRRFAGDEAPEEAIPRQALWSGFLSAGIHVLTGNESILLVAGETGTAITADAILLEEHAPASSETPPGPAFREPVDPRHNIEHLAPVEARFVRFTILDTNSSQPCLDELEIFSEETNVALASAGATATASSSLTGYEIHKLVHVNDGRYGNSHSWISNEPGAGWVQIELPQVTRIDRIEWARDREGRFGDRLATSYRIEVSTDGDDWQNVAGSFDRVPLTGPAPAAVGFRFDSLPPRGRELLARLQSAEAERDRLSHASTVYAGRFEQPGPTHRLYRGEPLAQREQVPPGIPVLFGDLELPAHAPEQQRRRALADWIASPDNPLTARVIVNRIWQHHFGQGLVPTPSDFGAGGVPPTHPELLDWLARELVTHDWSLKHIHRLILNSATYRQSSQPNPAALAIDGATQFWWRFPPRRLAAEPIRDSILAISGTLDLKMGGPGFSAFEIEAENVRHYHPKTSYGPEDWRRMIYMTKVRMEQDSVFGLFDCPDAATSVAQRSRSTTPLQALNLFNSQFLLQQAGLFAKRLESEHPGNLRSQVTLAYELCYSREPTEDEFSDATEFVQNNGLTAFCRALLNSNELLFLQ
jgi:hypothetical protein